MTLKGVELVASRRQIEAFIKADPVKVIFLRKTKIETADGGWRWSDPLPLPKPQQVRLIPFKRRLTEFLKNTELGDVSDLPYVLLGKHTLDVEKGDLFSIDGQKFEVKTLDLAEPEVKTLAQVDYYGGGVNA